MLKKTMLGIAFYCLILTGWGQAFEYYPEARYRDSIPTLKEVIGYDFGERIASHAEIERYVHALAESSPRAQVFSYGASWQGRDLYCMILASADNMDRLDEIRAGISKLADPEGLPNDEIEGLLDSLPSIVWLAYGVHGNEISSPDAALLTAYHLLAAENDPAADEILRNTVVLIDPTQNPDGRDRFVHYFQQTTGRWPDADPQAAEHNEAWPRGRTNHYLFDLNRDWFAMSQPETQGKVKIYLEWFPQIVIDLHEMGGDSTYYFGPPALPYNPELKESQLDWLERLGRNNARWFDRFGLDYFTREVFDSFYPGYGEEWPMFHGSIGMTYEQASVRGLVLDRADETTMNFRDTVRSHFIASISTLELAARNRRDLLAHFLKLRRSAIEEGRVRSVREFLFPAETQRERAARLMNLLTRQGIVVERAAAPFRNPSARDFDGRSAEDREFPAGTFRVRLDQPAQRLAATLLSKEAAMNPEFLEEQVERFEKGQPPEIFDLTAWSLPLMFNIDVFEAGEPSQGRFTALDGPVEFGGGVEGGTDVLAYLVPWGSPAAVRFLARLHQDEIRVFSAGDSFRIQGRDFPAGSLIVKTADHSADLPDRIRRAAELTGTAVYATDHSWVEEGVNFGSDRVRFLKAPRVAMAYQAPTAPGSVGATRYVLERQVGHPVTLLHTEQIPQVDLSRYDVLILPDGMAVSGGYDGRLGERGASQIKQWIQNGGTLIAIAEAANWLAGEDVGLLSTKREHRRPPESEDEKPENADEPKELPAPTPGAILRAQVDRDHWLGYGFEESAPVMVNSRNIFTPLHRTVGENVVRYEQDPEKLVLSGLVWKESRDQLAGKAFLMHQRHGRGRVVAFAEEPNVRAFSEGMLQFLFNAIFLGPSQ
ncbi:MAG TPA: M14 family metallopeptidase [Acidobacteriota bacterium]|nr:M14 family metallopeptidase [Acidobacteriota bacterium]